MEVLERHFDAAFDAPNGIRKLRELILTLAMQGKLVPQDSNDPPASELLKEIEREKKRLVKEHKIKEPKPLPAVSPESAPYALPKGWEWVRLREIGHDWGQQTPSSRFTYIDVGAIDNSRGTINPNPQILDSSEAPSRARKIVRKGTVIYSTVRPYLLNTAVVEKDFTPAPIASTAFAIMHPYAGVDGRYIYFFLRSPLFVRYVEAYQKGVAYPAISDGDLFNGVFPLPPSSEQSRIVAKINELMAWCDALEELRAERDAQRVTVHTAAVRQLLNVVDKDGHNRAREFLSQYFGELYTAKESVAELRKAILQLAVMGKLVPQDPTDQSAGVLLREIRNKRGVTTRAQITRSLSSTVLSPEEVPFKVPDGWQWARISDVAESIDYGTSQKTCDDASLVAVYRMGNIVNGKLVDEGFKYIRPDIDELPQLFLKPGDILFNRTNSYELVGKSALYTGPGNHATFASYLIRIRPFKNQMSPLFINMAMNAPYFRQTQIEPEIIQQCGQANFNGTKLSLCAIPVPPLPEQHRIVAEIEQLMSMCDSLEQQIDTASRTRTLLLDSLMAQFGGHACA